MRELFILIAHTLVTLAKLAKPGGLGAVAAESLAVKHQLLIMKRGPVSSRRGVSFLRPHVSWAVDRCEVARSALGFNLGVTTIFRLSDSICG
jgi:hypothetical protein